MEPQAKPRGIFQAKTQVNKFLFNRAPDHHHQRDERPLLDVGGAQPARALQPDGGAQERRTLEAQHAPPPTRSRRFVGEGLNNSRGGIPATSDIVRLGCTCIILAHSRGTQPNW